MSRIGRIKSLENNYHIMCRSISEFDLFRDAEDKQYYLNLLKKYCDKFHCSILAYCLMDTHVHFHIDTHGFDISKFMHGVNLSYVLFYNKKYKRHGHVFSGRFESRVVSSDGYNLAVSSYIHNNPKDIYGYSGREFEYPYSSMSIYMGIRKDVLNLVNTGFILGLFNNKDKNKAIKQYTEFVLKQRDVAADKGIGRCLNRFSNNEYRSERYIIYRNYKPDQVISFIAQKLGIASTNYIKLKSNRFSSNFRAFSVFVLRSLCNFTYKDICNSIGNISMSGVSSLCMKGFNLYETRRDLKDIFNEIIKLPSI